MIQYYCNITFAEIWTSVIVYIAYQTVNPMKNNIHEPEKSGLRKDSSLAQSIFI
jgi:hypothetical protein